MSAEALAIIDQLQALAPDVREEVVLHLLNSVDGNDDASTDDPELVRADWSAEIRRRVAAIRSGEAELIDWDEAVASLKQRFGP